MRTPKASLAFPIPARLSRLPEHRERRISKKNEDLQLQWWCYRHRGASRCWRRSTAIRISKIAALGALRTLASKSFEQAITDADSGMRRCTSTAESRPVPPSRWRCRTPVRLRLDGIRLGLRGRRNPRRRANLKPLLCQTWCRPSATPRGPFRMESDVPLVSPRRQPRSFCDCQRAAAPPRDGKAISQLCPTAPPPAWPSPLKALDLRFGLEAASSLRCRGYRAPGATCPRLISSRTSSRTFRRERRARDESRRARFWGASARAPIARIAAQGQRDLYARIGAGGNTPKR